jgi:cytochrome c-type biogenesis protein CcmH/NrfG
MNPYESPPPPKSPETISLRGPSRGFWLAIAGVFVALVVVLAIPYVQWLRHQSVKQEARENLRKISEAVKQHEKREVAK